MNEQAIYEALLDIKQTVGEVHATTKSLESTIVRHVQEDERVEERVRAIELAQAKQRGAIRTWAMVGTALASAASMAVAWFHK